MIHLGSVAIAGMWHHVQAAWVEREVTEGTTIRLQREPSNSHDAAAIMLHARDASTKAYTMLGYVPASQNACFAALMDAGFALVGQVTDVQARKGVVVVDIAMSEKRGRLAVLAAAKKVVEVARGYALEEHGDGGELYDVLNDYDAIVSK